MENYRTFFNFKIATIINNNDCFIVYYNGETQMVTSSHAAAVRKVKKAGYFFKK